MSAAAAAGTWKLGDLEVNRIGYGAMRLTGNGVMGNSDGMPIDRDKASAGADGPCEGRSDLAGTQGSMTRSTGREPDRVG